MGLFDFLFGKPQQQATAPPQPGGLLGTVPTGQQQMSYKDYAEMEMTKGNQPLPYAEWAKRQPPKK